MQSLLFKPLVWKAKQQALDKYGRAVTRRLDGLQLINEEPNRYKLSVPFVIAADGSFHWTDLSLTGAPASCGSGNIFCKPRFHAGQIVFVKEPWAAMSIFDGIKPKALHEGTPIWYKDTDVDTPTGTGDDMGKWRSPMFMQCRFARTFLKVLSVRPERLWDITEDDALLEGVSQSMASYLGLSTNSAGEEEFNLRYARRTYQVLWDSLGKQVKTINGDFIPFQNSWGFNPWIWRVELEQVVG